MEISQLLLLGRGGLGRVIGKLFQGISEGDTTSIAIASVIGLVLVGVIVVKARSGD